MSGFRLARLTQHRRRQRDEAQQRLAAVARALVDAHGTHARLIAMQQTQHEELVRALHAGPVAAHQLLGLRRQVEAAALAVERQAAEVRRLEQDQEAQRLQTVEHARAHRTLELAEERFTAATLAATRRSEQRTLDELSGVRGAAGTGMRGKR